MYSKNWRNEVQVKKIELQCNYFDKFIFVWLLKQKTGQQIERFNSRQFMAHIKFSENLHFYSSTHEHHHHIFSRSFINLFTSWAFVCSESGGLKLVTSNIRRPQTIQCHPSPSYYRVIYFRNIRQFRSPNQLIEATFNLHTYIRIHTFFF